MFKFLGCHDRAAGLPLSQPNLAVQPYATGQDVNVILVRVLVAHGHPGRITLIKSHALHEITRHDFPFFSGQALAGGERQGAMPGGLADVRAQLAHG